MTTLLELRSTLTSKGYSQISSTPEQQQTVTPITVHLHPLITNPVVLIGADSDTARSYQNELITEAIKRR